MVEFKINYITKIAISIILCIYAISAGIAAIYIGAVDKPDITTFPINLQVWLIVYGIVRLVTPFSLIRANKDFTKIVISPSNVFALIWLIWGNVLIAVYEWQSARMYTFAITIIIIEWIINFFAILAAIIVFAMSIINASTSV